MDGDEKKKRMTLFTSAWASLVARVVVIAAALGVLAGIGRAASAGPSIASDADAEAPIALAIPDATPPAVPTTTTPPAARAPGARATPDAPVFLNQADEGELRRLPGVGPKRAEAILALRVRVGRFRRIEDLLRVKGVGRRTIRKWRPLVRLEPAAGADASAP